MGYWNLHWLQAPIHLEKQGSVDRHSIAIQHLQRRQKPVEISNTSLTISSECDYTLFARGVAQLVSVPRLGRGGRRFESAHPDTKKQSCDCFFFLTGALESLLRHDHATIHFNGLPVDITGIFRGQKSNHTGNFPGFRKAFHRVILRAVLQPLFLC